MKVVIFDFDGVLADSFLCFYSLIRDSMASIGIDLSEGGYRNLFIGNVHQGFRRLIGDDQKYENFRKFRSDNYDAYYHKFQPKLFSGVLEMLVTIKDGHSLAIASSGRRKNIVELLGKNQATHLFKSILATDEFTKENMLRMILDEHGVGPEETIMVTDTVGDVAIAKEIGMDTIAVCWGFQSKETLKNSFPGTIVESVPELISKIKGAKAQG